MTKNYIPSNIPMAKLSMGIKLQFKISTVHLKDQTIIKYDNFNIEGIKNFKAFQKFELYIDNEIFMNINFIEYYDIKTINDILKNYIIINKFVKEINFVFMRNARDCDISDLKISYDTDKITDEIIYEPFKNYGDVLGMCIPNKNEIELHTRGKYLKSIKLIKTPIGLNENNYKFNIGLDYDLTIEEANEAISKYKKLNHIFIIYDNNKINMDNFENFFILLFEYA